MKRPLRKHATAPLALLTALTVAAAGQAAVPVTRVITDTFTNTTSPHAPGDHYC